MSLTTSDIQKISELFMYLFEQNVQPSIRQTVKEEVKNFVGALPSKAEYYSMMDKLMHEIQASCQEMTIIGHLLSKHENRIVQVEYDVDVLQKLCRKKQNS